MFPSRSNPDVPRKPDWMGNAKRTEAAPSRSRGVKRQPLIRVNPDDLNERDPTWWELVKRDARHGIPGALLSLVLHVAILLVFALIVIQIRGTDADVLFDLGWTPEPVASKRSAARGPVDVGAFTIAEQAPEKRKPLKLPASLGGNEGEEQEMSSGVSPVDVKNLFNNRSEEKRSEILGRHGELVGTERTIENALLWLKRQQRGGGSWSLHEGYPDAAERTMRTDTGATALALLAFLGTGQSHQAGEHKETVASGIDWLIANQKENGNFHDRYELGHQSTYYAHAMALIALCEAYALTGDERLREPAQRGLTFLLDSQNPRAGGWKYRPADELTVGDLSVTGWALMALHTARASGFEIDLNHFVRAGLFLETVAEQQGTRFKYMPSDPSDRVSVAMTAEGFLCRQFLGIKQNDPWMAQGVEWLLSEQNRPVWKAGRRNVYEWYYTAQVLHNLDDEQFQDWFQQVAKEIVRAQEKGGTLAKGKDVRGSWDPLEPIGAYHEYAPQAGRLYLTAMCVLVLETPYRHTPIYAEAKTAAR